jgi:hypothetical protein
MPCRRNPGELRHIAFKKHRHLMFKMTGAREGRATMMDWTSAQVSAAVIAGVVALLTAIITAFVTTRVAARQLHRQYQLEFASEYFARQLMQDRNFQLRSFEVIKYHLGGFEEDELRKILVRAGGIRFESTGGNEMWGLLSRNREWLGATIPQDRTMFTATPAR